ncbi:L-glyceraldehyde 3-phosphate reductase [compost metagenome]
MGLTTWSPLASGMLTGKYDSGITEGRLSRMDSLKDTFYTDENTTKVKAMKKLADAAECSRSQLALAWVAAQKGISSVILGATTIEQLKENLGALRVTITPEMDKELKKLFVI